MGRRRKNEITFPVTGENSEQVSSSLDAPVPTGFLRLKIPLREDGTLNLEAWDSKDVLSKEKYRELVKNPDFLEKIGAKKEDVSARKEDVSASDVAFAFDVYAVVVSFVFASVLKTQYDLVWEHVKFDEEQKKAMAEPLAKIASKYVPLEWLRYAPEFQLAVMLSGATAAKFNNAKQAVADAKKKKDHPAPEAHGGNGVAVNSSAVIQ